MSEEGERSTLSKLAQLAVWNELMTPTMRGAQQAQPTRKSAIAPRASGSADTTSQEHSAAPVRVKSSPEEDARFWRDVGIGLLVGVLVATGYGLVRYAQNNGIMSNFRSAAHETTALGFAGTPHQVTRQNGACLSYFNEQRAPLSPVKCLPQGTVVRGYVAAPSHLDVTEGGRRWLQINLTPRELETLRPARREDRQFPVAYVVPLESVRPLASATAYGNMPK